MPVLSHMSAIEYMESYRLDLEPRRVSLRRRAVDEHGIADAQFRAMSDEPIATDLLFGTASARWKKRGCVCHILPANIPAASFAKVGSTVVASPELCFLQMACKLSLSQLVVLGLRLCGNYDAGNVFPFDARKGALTSATRLRAYLAKCDGIKGVALARLAVNYVRDGSGSFAEANVYALMVLPRHRGGYGLKCPRLNVPLGSSGRVADFLWDESDFVVEYDSREHHMGDLAFERDSVRRIDIELNRFRVCSLTLQQYRDALLFDKAVRVVAWYLGQRVRPSTEKDWTKRSALRRELGLLTYG